MNNTKLSSIKNTKNYCKAGFTLAETLITLGIIGVVAALTIPNITRYYKAMVLENQLKKTYSLMQQVINRYYAETGQKFIDKVTTTANDNWALVNAFKKYVPGTRVCGAIPNGTNEICTIKGRKPAKLYFNLTNTNNSNGNLMYFQGFTLALPDDTSINIVLHSSNQRHITVDINGYYKGPNRKGQDVFIFYFDGKGTLRPAGDQQGCSNKIHLYCDAHSNKDSQSYKYYDNGISCTCAALNDHNFWKQLPR